MNVSIKKATIKDLDAINEIFRLSKASWGYDDAFMLQCMADYAVTVARINKDNVYLFHIENILVGFYGFSYEDDHVELDYFFLHPNYFGKGIGRTLWKACLKTAKILNISHFILYSDPNAEDFYLHMGCQKIGEQESPIMRGRMLPVLNYQVVSTF